MLSWVQKVQTFEMLQGLQAVHVIGRENIVQDAAVDRVVIHDQQRLRGDVWGIPDGLFHLAALSFARSRPVPRKKESSAQGPLPRKGLWSLLLLLFLQKYVQFWFSIQKNSFSDNTLTSTICI